MNISVNGFSPENLERVYTGEPALVEGSGKLPSEALSVKEFETAGLAAEGMTYEEIAAHLGRSLGTVRSHLRGTYAKLGICTKSGLAGYFPIDPEDPRLAGKTLGQLGPRTLEVVEGFTQGKVYKTIASDMDVSASTAKTHMHAASKIWVDCPDSPTITRTANGIRADYLRRINEAGNDVSRHLSDFALYNLVEYEHRIRELFGLPDVAEEAAA